MRLNSTDTLVQNHDGSLYYIPSGSDSLVLSIRLSGQEVLDTLSVDVLPNPSGNIILSQSNTDLGFYCIEGQDVWVGPTGINGLLAIPSVADAFAWYWDGQAVAGANSDTLFLSSLLTVGQHTLSLRRTLEHPALDCHRLDSLLITVLGDDTSLPCLPRLSMQSFEVDTSSGRGVGVKDPAEVLMGLVPNPTQGELTISCQESLSSYTIHNSIGQVVQAGSLLGNSNQTIRLEGLPAGLYVLQAQTAQGALTQTRFVLAP
jgi:hypothetical protein